jgi:hypothetical protein
LVRFSRETIARIGAGSWSWTEHQERQYDRKDGPGKPERETRWYAQAPPNRFRFEKVPLDDAGRPVEEKRTIIACDGGRWYELRAGTLRIWSCTSTPSEDLNTCVVAPTMPGVLRPLRFLGWLPDGNERMWLSPDRIADDTWVKDSLTKLGVTRAPGAQQLTLTRQGPAGNFDVTIVFTGVAGKETVDRVTWQRASKETARTTFTYAVAREPSGAEVVYPAQIEARIVPPAGMREVIRIEAFAARTFQENDFQIDLLLAKKVVDADSGLELRP